MPKELQHQSYDRRPPLYFYLQFVLLVLPGNFERALTPKLIALTKFRGQFTKAGEVKLD